MSSEDACKLFVAGLPDAISEEVLRELFEATGGTVVEVSVPKDRATGRPRGFGFVTLATAQQALRARSSRDGSVQAGRSISVRPFQGGPKRGADSGTTSRQPRVEVVGASGSDRRLYVGNLPYDCTEDELGALLGRAQVPDAADINLPVDADGRGRGFGFLTMASAEAAQSAQEALNGQELRGRRIVVNIALPKGERAARPEHSPGPPPSLRGSAPARANSAPVDRSSREPSAFPPMLGADRPRRTFDERRRSAGQRLPEIESRERKRPRVRERDKRSKSWRDYDEEDE